MKLHVFLSYSNALHHASRITIDRSNYCVCVYLHRPLYDDWLYTWQDKWNQEVDDWPLMMNLSADKSTEVYQVTGRQWRTHVPV